MGRTRLRSSARIIVLAVLGSTVFASPAALAAPAPTVLTTQASGPTTVGQSITDRATLGGATSPTGVVTFMVFGPNDPTCSHGAAASITATVSGAAPYAPLGGFSPQGPGTYNFTATYSGDANNAAASSACGSQNESVVVSKVTPTVVTAAPASAVLGSAVTGTATIGDGFSPTGTISWNLYGPNDLTCTGTPQTSGTTAVSGNGTYASPAFTPATPGSYRLAASYGGDANNAAVPVTCGAASGLSIQAQPTLTLQASPAVPVGGNVSATATVGSGSSPTGTILFSLYGPADASCAGTAAFTSTATVTGNGAYTSTTFQPPTNGTWRFTAAYSGDAANMAVRSGCGSPSGSVLVGKAITALATTASAPVPVLGSIFDNATLAGGANPTGTITFNLYNLNDPTCAAPPVYAPTATVDGNGTYSSGAVEGGAPGSFNWAVSYSGDANNQPATSPCGSPGETSVVYPASSTRSPGVADGYWLLAADGGVFNYGSAVFLGSGASIHLNKPIVAMAATPDRKGFLIVASDGGVFIYGDAGYYGSAAALHLNSPIVGLAITPDRKGYWMVAADGGIFAYGDATFYGSAGSQHLNSPIVGMVTTADGKGYWTVAADGGIFAYGDASFHGSAGSVHLNKPIVGMAAMPSGDGYWLVASDGGIFSYGSAAFHGSAGSTHLNKPIVGMAPSADGGGYWLAASDGGIFTYGDATFRGSAGGSPLNRPIVGIAAG